MDDILRRLGHVETDVSELRSEVRAISATIPHLAKAASVSEILAVIPHLATKVDVKADITKVMEAIAEVKTDVASMETKIIKWIIATTLTTAALAFTIARFVH